MCEAHQLLQSPLQEVVDTVAFQEQMSLLLLRNRLRASSNIDSSWDEAEVQLGRQAMRKISAFDRQFQSNEFTCWVVWRGCDSLCEVVCCGKVTVIEHQHSADDKVEICGGAEDAVTGEIAICRICGSICKTACQCLGRQDSI